jgi:2-polyprenyl-3-methyl-5-hydroxy-6-metoxy-1,4-benzoquinol methylase
MKSNITSFAGSIKQTTKKHLPALVHTYHGLKNCIKNEHKNMALYYLGLKKNRNQWKHKVDFKYHKDFKSDLMTWSWDELQENATNFHKRISACVEKADGLVLEIGCGIGYMTRWLSDSPKVDGIIAIDAFPQAIEKLETYSLPKVTAFVMHCEDLRFEANLKFDTVIICELLEHLYPDEERNMLQSLRSYTRCGSSYIISTPIGWLNDKFHVRGFSQESFIKHLKKYYGVPVNIDYSSGYSQVAYGRFK